MDIVRHQMARMWGYYQLHILENPNPLLQYLLVTWMLGVTVAYFVSQGAVSFSMLILELWAIQSDILNFFSAAYQG